MNSVRHARVAVVLLSLVVSAIVTGFSIDWRGGDPLRGMIRKAYGQQNIIRVVDLPENNDWSGTSGQWLGNPGTGGSSSGVAGQLGYYPWAQDTATAPNFTVTVSGFLITSSQLGEGGAIGGVAWRYINNASPSANPNLGTATRPFNYNTTIRIGPSTRNQVDPVLDNNFLDGQYTTFNIGTYNHTAGVTIGWLSIPMPGNFPVDFTQNLFILIMTRGGTGNQNGYTNSDPTPQWVDAGGWELNDITDQNRWLYGAGSNSVPQTGTVGGQRFPSLRLEFVEAIIQGGNPLHGGGGGSCFVGEARTPAPVASWTDLFRPGMAPYRNLPVNRRPEFSCLFPGKAK
jgi:hypothetical protein